MQVNANIAAFLAEVARKAAASAEASEEGTLSDMKAAISSIDKFGAEGSQSVAADEVSQGSCKGARDCLLPAHVA